MQLNDPTTYADLSQGQIKHIDFRIGVDFSTHTLDIEARYQMQEPVHGSLYFDTYQIDLTEARTDTRTLDWEFDTQDDIVVNVYI